MKYENSGGGGGLLKGKAKMGSSDGDNGAQGGRSVPGASEGDITSHSEKWENNAELGVGNPKGGM